MAYIGTQPKDVRSFGKAKFDFTATQGQTAFTGADDDGKTLGFTDGQINVYVNGILMDDSDYSTSGSNTVTLSAAANANDIISVVALQTDIPNSDYVPATGGTFSGDVTHSGDVTFSGSINGNVGIGTSSLDLVGSTTSLTINHSGGNGQLSLMGNGTVYGRIFADNATGDLKMGNPTSNDVMFYTANLERMRIDSAGRVTMPYQPAFDVGLTSGGINGANTVILWNNVRLNQGSHYSSSTGRFTAPIDGVYEFYWGGIKNATTAVTRLVLRRNGTGVRENRLAEGDTYNAACWKMLIELNANDYVDIQMTAGSFYGQTDFYGNAFGGHLVG